MPLPRTSFLFRYLGFPLILVRPLLNTTPCFGAPFRDIMISAYFFNLCSVVPLHLSAFFRSFFTSQPFGDELSFPTTHIASLLVSISSFSTAYFMGSVVLRHSEKTIDLSLV